MEVRALLFNHDQFSSRSSALNLRFNSTQPARLPEWVPGDTHLTSVAAYASGDVDLSELRVHGKFRAPEFAGKSVEVATMPPLPSNLPPQVQDTLNALLFLNPAAYLLWRNYFQYVFALSDELNDDVLGQISATSVQFDGSGESDWTAFPLQNTRLKTVGVNRHFVTWTWIRRAGLAWLPFATTAHRIYTVLDTPNLPWLQLPFSAANTQLPWITALDVACQWAAGATVDTDACQRITRAVYELGEDFFEYGCDVGATTTYSEPFFNLTKFLERIGGGIGLGRYVNCSDCATFVSTFANLLGADLWQSQMRDFDRGFPVNPIRAIGFDDIVPPCGVGIFNYHEVAWTGQATGLDDVFDACLEVDTNPLLIPPQMVLPTGMRFGMEGDGQYRDFLAAPFGRNLCRPQPQLKRRRAII